jgi:DNA polymerase-3 subunit alpha
MEDIVSRVEEIVDNMIHWHVHTTYSFLDGFNFPSAAAKRAKELGMTHLCITDHNHLGGVLDFQKACKEEGIVPVLGCEMYWTYDTKILSLDSDGRREWAMESARKQGFDIDGEIYKLEHPVSEKTGKPLKARKAPVSEVNKLLEPYAYNTKQYHIILLAINQTGWQNLVKLQSEAAERCTYNGRFCCDDTMLANYSEGLVFTTACVGNVVPHYIENHEYEKAKEQIETWHNIFGDRMFLEIQPLNIEEQRMTNMFYMNWSKELGIKLVATTDAHYTLKSDWDDHDTLLCVGIGKKKADEDRMHYSNDYWIKSYAEMIEDFETQTQDMANDFGSVLNVEAYKEAYVEALANTNLIADLVEDIKLGSEVDLFPNVEVPNGFTPEEHLRVESYKGLYRYKNKKQEIHLPTYEKRLYDELNIINGKGYAPYMLAVKEYVDWANDNGCPTGPGRGSAAGALTLFTNGITKVIDPIENNLLFFRFLTADRTSPPDIDTDFSYENRHKVIEHLEDKYGKDHVSHIGTYTELGVKNGLKDVGRVLDIDFGVMNNITKKIDEWCDKPELYFKDLDNLQGSDKEDERIAWREFRDYEEQYAELFRLARRFEGIPRNCGVHASGILITPMPVSDLFPTRVDPKEGTTVTLYTGPQLEELKAIKFDILGLKTLSVIDRTLKSIDPDLTFEDLYEQVDVNDPYVFEMIQGKNTEGVFQIESNLFKGMIEDIIPTSLNDIVVLNALGRPGPLKAGMPKSYALRKNGLEEAVEPLRDTWEFVSDTFGTIAYQEQIMLIAKRVAGFNDNQSDSYLRKAFAKKKKDKMAQCRQWFIYGKINEEAPEGYDKNNKNQPDYDSKAKYGPAIIGGIQNGYKESELIAFWTNIEGFADYLFNKSHAACYGYIGVLTAWLKRYYPAKYMAALLSMQGDQAKIDAYIKVSRNMEITVKAPDINLSSIDFSEVNGEILYGIASVKGVGASSIPSILENRPYIDLEDAMNKKVLNKKTGNALISAGAFDFYNPNRYSLIEEFRTIRKDAFDPDNVVPPAEEWSEEACIALERELLGAPVTYVPWWDTIKANETFMTQFTLTKVSEKKDRNGNMMAFVEGTSRGCEISGVVFARTYCANVDMFDMQRNTLITITGKKDEKGKMIVNAVADSNAEIKVPRQRKAPAKKVSNDNKPSFLEDFCVRLEDVM